MTSRAAVLLALSALAVATGGCGERREPGGVAARTSPVALGEPAATTANAAATIDVSLGEYRLQPPDARLARAGVIAFVATNDGQTRHALAVEGSAGEAASATLRPGERATIAVRLPPGTYKWFCPVADHEQRGMVGRVRVAE